MIINYSQIINNNSSFSTSIYSSANFKSFSLMPAYFYRELDDKDFGEEAESLNYIDKSDVYFMRAGSLSGGIKSSDRIDTQHQ